ncbi:u3 small nucleolar ribonucleoprotein MPP10 [Rhizophlyctis rosea]|nr:u3 small nucleolar ribonucleoprotein MPP10 [Rhizophlyctis rosea]
MPVAVDTKSISEDFLPTVAGRPDKFLEPDAALAKRALHATKWLFDLGKRTEPYIMSPLPELLLDGFDAEQVWEQVRLQSEPMTEYLSTIVSDLVEGRKRKREGVSEDEEGQVEKKERSLADGNEADEYDYEAMLEAGANGECGDELDGLDGEEEELEDDGADLLDDLEEDADLDDGADLEEEEEGDDEELGEAEGEEEDEPVANRPSRRSEVDDDFFSLEEMEKFADFGEARDQKKARKGDAEEEEDEDDEFTIGDDLLAMDPDEWDDSEAEMDNANDITYEEFFGPREKEETSRVRFSDRLDVKEIANREDDGEGFEGMDIDGEEDGEDDEDDEAAGKTIAERVSDLLGEFGDDDAQTEELSTFEKQQLKLQKSIDELEAEAVAAKPWTLKGEASAKARPSNSLLEEDLEIEYAAKPVPVITEEKTASLEDLIRQRIKDQLFDDVIRKAPPRDREYDPNARRAIDEEKSGKSLAELYEVEYVKQTTGTQQPTEKDEKLQKAHQEIDDLFRTLTQNLDALSNFHYTPKPTRAELEILPAPTVPAIQMEEVTPAAVSDATLITPKEVFSAPVGKSQDELNSSEKRKARAKEKRKLRKIRTERAKERAAVEAAKPEGLKRVESEKRGKERALEQLMGQGNVTIVADKRTKGVVDGRQKRGKDVNAKIVQKGGKVGDRKEEGKVKGGQMLRL